VNATIPSALALLVLSTGASGANAQDAVDTQRVLGRVRIEQNLGARLPLDLPFRNHRGETVRLGDCFGEKPVLLALVYYECPMLCTLVLNDVLRCLRALPLDVGEDFELLAVSIDPGETPELAAKKRDVYRASYGRESADAGWNFLVGDEASIAALTDTVGFRYVYDPATDEYAHAAGIQIVTPDGVLSRYFYGLEYPPRDVRLGLVEASNGAIGSAVDQVLLFCFHYDPITGKYGLVIMNVVRLAGALTVALLVGFVVLMLRRDRKRRFVIAAEGGA
jgi:protein SCO1/2